MRIERPTPATVREVALAMRERDFEEFSAVHDVATREELAARLARLYGSRDDVQVAYYRDAPVAVIGQIMPWPGVISLLFFATKDFGRVVTGITRVYRRMFDEMEASGVHRIQAISLAGHTKTHKFLSIFGLQQEGPPMRSFGKNGEAFLQFARIVDVRPPGA